MGIFSAFMSDRKERSFIGETGLEDDIIVAMLEQMDGATIDEIKKVFEERGRKIDDAALKISLEKLVRERRIYWDEKLKGYCFKKEGGENQPT